VRRFVTWALGVLRAKRALPAANPGYGSVMTASVKMYTRQWCGYCTAAQRLLASKNVAYEEIDCTGDQKTRRWLVEQTGRTTVPQIFIDGRSIGGYDDLSALDRSGELDRLLFGAPASTQQS
jgi:glutaredoxin 3